MQPGFSNMQPTPGWKGNDPSRGEPLAGDAAPLRRQSAMKRLFSRIGRKSGKPKT